jgi:hypothetical protein
MSLIAKKSRRSRHLQYENLERREMMAVTGSLKSGVLTIKGTKGADTVNFVQTAGVISVAGVKNGSWAANSVNSVVIDLGKNNDSVSFNSLANGGSQALAEYFTVRTKHVGWDTVHLADGHDVALNGKGHTLTVTPTGVATLNGQVLSWNTPPSPPSPPTPPAPPSTNWFDSHVVDAALRTLGRNLYTDGLIDRNDMIALLRNAQDNSTIDATELTDLRTITSNTTLFGTFDYVWKLSSYIVSGNTANAKYQGQALGNLAAGSSAAQMEKLIGKWYLGLDHSTASGTYRQVSGTLFVGGAAYTDIKQGYLGDCYFMASLAETALKNPSAIANMFVVNGDGTYTVKFFNSGQAAYVTVDSFLPTDGAGRLIYANMGALYNNAGNELWTALAEKAYVQINEMGWLRPGLPGNGQNAYAGVEGGYIYAALGQITGQSTVAFASTAGTSSFNTFVTAFNQGKSIGFASKSTPASTSVVGNHAYAVLSYNTATQKVTLYNPWGTSYALVTMTWAELQGSFSYFDRTA